MQHSEEEEQEEAATAAGGVVKSSWVPEHRTGCGTLAWQGITSRCQIVQGIETLHNGLGWDGRCSLGSCAGWLAPARDAL